MPVEKLRESEKADWIWILLTTVVFNGVLSEAEVHSKQLMHRKIDIFFESRNANEQIRNQSIAQTPLGFLRK